MKLFTTTFAPRLLSFSLVAFSLAPALVAQNDPGPRPGPPNAGRPLAGLTTSEMSYFREGLTRFLEIDSVSGTQPGAPGVGLGPRFNSNSCASCHAQPSIGGSSPSPKSPQHPHPNPQIALATAFGAQNRVPAFLQPDGPVRVVRFVRQEDGAPDGGVHALFVITGRGDAGSCNISQPDFAQAAEQNNMTFRIPTPVYGAGLLESIPDAAILANKAANGQAKADLGIAGRENRSGNDGTITRYGWKAQNKSLQIFAGEAYNVEQGVTNEIFPTERDEAPGCVVNTSPEDHTNLDAGNPLAGMSDVSGFAAFMRFLAPPDPAPPSRSTLQGQQHFMQLGCALCHNPSFTTGQASSAALSHQSVPLYSDLLVHHMGDQLADGITQGLARGDEFRTAPLWGLGQRIFFLHDGRALDLTQAIQMHDGRGSEAHAVVGAFNALAPPARQDLLNFLRSL